MKYILPFLIVLLISCERDIVDDGSNAVIGDIVVSNISDIAVSSIGDIVVSKNHLSFPDLVYFNNMWYVVYRESDGHIGTYSIIKVLKSKDFDKWEEIFSYELSGWDLRDPKFSLNQSYNKLYLHFHSTTFKNYGVQRENLYIEYNQQINNFSKEEADIKKIVVPTNYENIWLWRPEWNNGVLYCIGYNPNIIKGVVLFTYPTITATNPNITPLLDHLGATEGTIRFNNDQVYCLIRRNSNDAILGEYNIKKTSDFSWNNIISLYDFGGPNMVLSDDFIFLGGRKNDSLFIGRLKLKDSNNSIEELEKLPSMGDCSYPGMVLFNNMLYIAYYTQKDNGYAISFGIYDFSK